MRQPSLFDPPKPSGPPPEDFDLLRRHLHSVLRDLRRADYMPWGKASAVLKEKDFRYNARIFPADERDAMIAEFEKELERCRRASAGEPVE